MQNGERMEAFQGSLFANDFLRESIVRLDEWQALDDEALDDIGRSLRALFDHFPLAQTPNESQTEDDLIWPVLANLGWTSVLRQQNLTPRGIEDKPDGLLFADESAKDRANGFAEEWRRYEFGLVIVESKRWTLSLDARSDRQARTAPSTQMLRYLRRVEDLTTGRLRWGILTNGARWRLYYQGARSVSEEFFEIDLAAVLDLPGHNDGLFALSEADRRHWLRVFVLLFRRDAFVPAAADPRTFHQRALEEGRFYEQRVAKSLFNLVFDRVFPALARAIAEAAPAAPLPDVRDATLTLLYRLLFMLYAEDRELLPVRDERYDDYGLRANVRDDVGRRKDLNDVFSANATRYWSAVDDLTRAIDQGDASIGLPPYNGGLFDRVRTPLLADIRLGDQVMANVIDALSFVQTATGRHYINYRDLSVQQLGSIYERLLEQELARDGEVIVVRPNVFARKGSGSYFTPHNLVNLILRETIEPLIRERIDKFASVSAEPATRRFSSHDQIDILKRFDPAERILELRICDPAMGSGHFLVGLVDYLADRVIAAMAEAEAMIDGYVSPLTERIDEVRRTIRDNAADFGWTVDGERLDDRHLVRRIVLKRCVYGVDRNPMAVELAKVSLWLHTFTAGAPLSFLDHHLRCGNSLFGCWTREAFDTAMALGSPLFLHEPLNRAMQAARSMQTIEELTDAEIAQSDQSAGLFNQILAMTAPLDAFLSLVHAFEWLDVRDLDRRAALRAFFQGAFGDPVGIATGDVDVGTDSPLHEQFAELLEKARAITVEERFFNWQPAFPSVWSDWDIAERQGGFDAVIGNPPWDRMKLQQIEWFNFRRPEIALAQRAADRRQMIAALRVAGDPLADEFDLASARAESAARIARRCGDYPLLSGGDINIYSLFVERAFALVKPEGVVGLLTPSGIASDKTSARFFKEVATEGRLRALYDFENRKVFFPDVHASFKFCVFVAGRAPAPEPARCAFYLHDLTELSDPNRCFPLAARDFARVNPNTGTAPVFRSHRDADLTTAIYRRLPVLVDRSGEYAVKAWPVKYERMFDMTNDSNLFRTRRDLEEREGAWPSGGNRFDSPTGEWLPLYEGKMVQAFDHRAASVVVNPENLHRPAQPKPATEEQHRDADWLPDPQYWVAASECDWPTVTWILGFKEITASTNVRTFISAILPAVGFGNKVPIFKPETPIRNEWLLAANFNATTFDFVTRQKVQGQTLNLYIVEQLPVVPPGKYEETRFGSKTAGEIVREAVLELTYTAHDMAPFARDLGHVDDTGAVRPPFRWDDERRLHLRAKLDALFFHLYGITDRDDVRYIWSTFPIVEQHENGTHGRYRSRDLCLAYMNALAAGRPDAMPDA